MGTPDFAVASLDAIVQAGHDIAAAVTVPDRQTGRGLKLTFSPVKQYAMDHHLPLLQPDKLRDPQFIANLQALQADLFIVVAFRMLPQVVWAMPPLGTFNLHASLLPDYRGAAPINWAIINGETETGVTTFLLNDKIDEGQILMQQRTPINPNDNAETLHDKLAATGSQLVTETIQGLQDGTLQPHRQPRVTMLKTAPKIFKDDCAIHWDWPGEHIVNFVRGLSPYPAASLCMQDEHGDMHTFKVFDVRFEPRQDNPQTNALPDAPTNTVHTTLSPCHSAVPTLFCEDKKRIKIALFSGNLEILSLQINGKRKNTSEEFLRGHNIRDWKIVQYKTSTENLGTE